MPLPVSLIGPLQSIKFSSGFMGLSTNIGSLLMGPNSALLAVADDGDGGAKDWFLPAFVSSSGRGRPPRGSPFKGPMRGIQ